MAELHAMMERRLTASDGFSGEEIVAAEKRLKLKLPVSLKTYYELAGNLELNTQHNRLYAPFRLEVEAGKLIFMEENQAVVFWGIDLKHFGDADPEVFQAANAKKLVWYSEELRFSDWIIKTWKWQLGIGSNK